MRPATLPSAERYAHGTRARYVAKCRCDDCRRANREYQATRAAAQKGGDWNGLVPADKARAHLLDLRAKNIGRRAVAAASDVPETILSKILNGSKTQIRARSEKAILGVDEGAIADSAYVLAKETWRRIREMVRAGHSKAELAQRLGYASPALQFRKTRVEARTALLIERLHREILAELATEAAMPEICGDCGNSHEPEERQRLIRRMVLDGATAGEVVEEWSCFYAGGSGYERACRDAKAIRGMAKVAA